MARITATVTFTYEVDESAYPGGMDETDISREEDIVLNMLQADFRRERVNGRVEDITLEVA